jgi:hypothetical protein
MLMNPPPGEGLPEPADVDVPRGVHLRHPQVRLIEPPAVVKSNC